MKKLYRASQVKKVVSTIKQRVLYTQGRNANYRTYYTDLCCGFDIETTTLDNKNAYMYIWQFSINEYTFIGRTWQEFLFFLDDLAECICKNKYSKRKVHVIIWVANLGFEFQFIRKKLNINKLFARKEREPLYFLANEVFEFRDCLSISGGSLAYLAKMYTKTQKLVGDLDYSIIRNHLTPMKFSEMKYVINDVRILAEFAKYIFDTFVIPKHRLPLTKTGIVRDEIRDKIDETVYQKIKKLYPNKDMYDFMMKWLFRGGYTHANALHSDVILHNVMGIDFKSSYPFVMANFKYPMSKFERIDNMTEDKLKEFSDFDKHSYFMVVEFHNIKSTTWHSLESLSKCIDISAGNVDKFIDNGRVQKAKYMKVCLTNYDFDIYNKLYEWDSCNITDFWYCLNAPLPDYLLDVLFKHYENKERLALNGKKNTLEYQLEKGDVNSNYGMCVTKLNNTEIEYTELDEWKTVPTSKSYDKLISSQFLLPQWGIWITSIARWNLLRFFDKDMIGNDIVYSDTDSIYMLNYEKHKHIIYEYNKETRKKMQAFFSSRLENQEEIELCSKLGTFELDPVNIKFKTLGAKRYIKTYIDKGVEVDKVTIAGLPKGALIEYCKKKNVDIYETFTNFMDMDLEYSMKNAHKYNDEIHSDYVDGVLMQEDSSCGIFKTTFTLTLDNFYYLYLQSIERTGIRNEYDEIY